ncbi:MAG: hypothetical protein ACFB2W_00750 [Leptolyngbyaceae cyanobacterium]
MRSVTKLWLAQIGAAGLTLAAGIGSLEPTYTLESGTQVNAWAVAKASGQRVVHISPNLGWLKIVASAGGIGLAVWAWTLTSVAEEEELNHQATQAVFAEMGAEQQRLAAQAELEAMKPVAQAVAQTKATHEMAKLASSGKVVALPEAVIEAPPVPQKYAEQLPDFIDELSSSPKTVMCVGVPGAGKGMLMANYTRAVKQKYPDLWIMGVDPKADPKEAGYLSQGFDKPIRFNNEKLDAEHVLDAVERCIEAFKAHEGPKLLVLDEMTVICRRCKSADKKRYQEIVDYLISICSSGDSRQIYFWGMGQSANAEDYGFSGGIRSIFKPVAIVSKTDIAASKQLLLTKFVPTDEGAAEIIKMMDYSPVGRAIYWYPEGRWYPMPELHNYSGYDRDKRQTV